MYGGREDYILIWLVVLLGANVLTRCSMDHEVNGALCNSSARKQLYRS